MATGGEMSQKGAEQGTQKNGKCMEMYGNVGKGMEKEAEFWGMVNMPPMKMLMTGALFYPHY